MQTAIGSAVGWGLGNMSIQKVQNNKAWFMVMPVPILVAISAIIPLMTVVNYSVQDTFGNNEFFLGRHGMVSRNTLIGAIS